MPRSKPTPGPWYFNPLVDFDEWYPVISTAKGDNQTADCGKVILAFHPGEPLPSVEDMRVILSAPMMVKALEDINGVANPCLVKCTHALCRAVRIAKEAVKQLKGE